MEVAEKKSQNSTSVLHFIKIIQLKSYIGKNVLWSCGRHHNKTNPVHPAESLRAILWDEVRLYTANKGKSF